VLLSCVGFLASRPPDTPIQWVLFYLSGAGLLAGSVVLSGALIRGAVTWCGVSDTAAGKIFRHFIGIGFSSSAAYLLGFAALNLALIGFHPGPEDFPLSQRERALNALGYVGWSVFFWPAQGLTQLSGQTMPGWLLWLSCSLLYGVTLYGLVILARRGGKRVTEQDAR
jgi:hypothetical protein